MKCTSVITATLALSSMLTSGANAAVILDFTGVNTHSPNSPVRDITPTLIGGYYDGGVSGDGTSGPNYGISFGADLHYAGNVVPTESVSVRNFVNHGWREPQNAAGKTSGFTLNPNQFGNELTLINVSGGFTKLLSFDFASYCFVGFEIHDGLNGTGSILASGSFNRDNGDDVPCPEGASGSYCLWQTAVVPFRGTAKSFWLTEASPDSTIFTRLAVGARPDIFPGSVPEPAVWTELVVGFGLVGAMYRRRRGAKSELSQQM